MRVLVIGGTGFIGFNIVERLVTAGHEVTVFHRGVTPVGKLLRNVNLIQGDRDRLDASAAAFERLRPDVVVDAIAFTKVQAVNVVKAFRGIAKRIVVLSSGDVYRANDIVFGRVPGEPLPTPLAESAALRDRLYPYRGVPLPPMPGFSWDDYDKILVEQAIVRNAELSGTSLRLPMVFGPGDYEGHKRRFWPYLKRMDDGRRAIVLDRRSARWRAPWGYVEDVAEAVRLAVENNYASGEVYNVGERESLDMEGWIRELAAVVGWQGRVVVVDEPCPPPSLPGHLNLNQHLDMDTTKIREDLGYCETVSRLDALAKTVAWDRKYPPKRVDSTQFDYAAEDAVLSRL